MARAHDEPCDSRNGEICSGVEGRGGRPFVARDGTIPTSDIVLDAVSKRVYSLLVPVLGVVLLITIALAIVFASTSWTRTLDQFSTRMTMVADVAALRIADHCYILAEGRNQIDGPAADLLNDARVGEIYLGGRRVRA